MVYRENNPRKSISSYWLPVYPNQLIRLRKEKKNCITSDHSPWFFSNGMVLTVTIWFSNRFSGFPMYMESAPGLTELYWALLIHLYHCNARVCKSLLEQISAFYLQRSFYFKNKLIHKCIIYFSLRRSSAFKGVARSHARAACERRRFARHKLESLLAGDKYFDDVLCCKLLQIQKRSNANISADARQATDPIRDNLWLDRVCDQTWWSSASQSSSV